VRRRSRQELGTVAVDPEQPEHLLLGAGSSLFQSHDGGATWSATSLVAGRVSALAVDPADADTVYACGGLFGDFLVRTVDGGATWTLTAAGGGAVTTAPQLPGFVAAGGNGVPHPVAVSQDRGATWTCLDAGLPPRAFVHSLAVDPTSTAAQVTLYAATETGVFEITFAPQAP